jgi:hypothetical protein
MGRAFRRDFAGFAACLLAMLPVAARADEAAAEPIPVAVAEFDYKDTSGEAQDRVEPAGSSEASERVGPEGCLRSFCCHADSLPAYLNRMRGSISA